ncbi:glycosyl hydrolase 115 family protein [Pedobacter cryophilus]|uniref:Gylcosyl hydrolase 115 C-terminal domain-containing protein n=1 Tax=Pedobacter cryophilus TaxID=2571271 RepID=A0A4U1C009_9SPHI|nr:glycosyl hydrolase 115 family protein [Pedobacter cryophilus]TKB96240.1 hypothetical protein FA046_13715 [Pedobacter cryophilus]
MVKSNSRFIFKKFILFLKGGFFCLFLFFCSPLKAQNFEIFTSKHKVSIVYSRQSVKLDSITAHLLAKDIYAVSGYLPLVYTDVKEAKGNVIILGNSQHSPAQSFPEYDASLLKNKWEVFSFVLLKRPNEKIKQALVITGSDARGLAYGVFHLSEKMGINPWYDWADVHPEKRKSLIINIKDTISKTPSVKYRGIFLNDEDWGLRPWAANNIDTALKNIGPKTYARIFELLLRLKANMIWPAMHPGTKAFFNIPENLAVAKAYEIIVGSSHAEPMLRNNVDEWKETSMGAFNYVSNPSVINNYWQKRIEETQGLQAIYSLGIRGVHDSGMEGVKNNKEAIKVLGDVFKAQRNMLSNALNKDLQVIPQALTLYKEVLDIYDEGLNVPEDVTLVWPDDNYGYIRRLGNLKENKRSGGAGVYYHISYWGRPHDYLWLSTTPPALVHQEMLKAYQNEAKNMWIVNVGDIKPSEYQTQLFLDMAYEMEPFQKNDYLKQHLTNWLQQIFKLEETQNLTHIMQAHYQLALERKPEFMGWSQTEPTTQIQQTKYNHFAHGDEAQKRIQAYLTLENQVAEAKNKIPLHLHDAFYQLIEYPVIGASNMNKKFIYHDKSMFYGKQGRLSAKSYTDSMFLAYENIQKATIFYNSTLSKGKWAGMMSAEPRNLPVFALPKTTIEMVPQKTVWNIAVDGASNLESDTLIAPTFYGKADEKFFIDIFLQKDVLINWKAETPTNWIKFSQNQGTLNAKQNQYRIWLKPNLRKLPKSNQIADVQIKTNQGNKVIRLNYQVNDKKLEGIFKEQNGYVSIFAANYSNKFGDKWQLIEGLGYSGKVMSSGNLPLTKPDSLVLTYQFYNSTSAKAKISVFTVPTLPLNNELKLRYAIRIDKGEWKEVNFETFGRSNQWKENVLSNITKKDFDFPKLAVGIHELEIKALDPQVMIDRILIDMGGLKPAYSVIKETK